MRQRSDVNYHDRIPIVSAGVAAQDRPACFVMHVDILTVAHDLFEAHIMPGQRVDVLEPARGVGIERPQCKPAGVEECRQQSEERDYLRVLSARPFHELDLLLHLQWWILSELGPWLAALYIHPHQIFFRENLPWTLSLASESMAYW